MEERLVRIEESMKHIQVSVECLPSLAMRVALIERDKKWIYTIIAGIMTFAVTIVTIIVKVYAR